MGLTKQYLRYVPKSSFGLISSAKGGIVSLGSQNIFASATAENVTVWNVKTGAKIVELKTESHGEITALAQNPHNGALAVGYADGTIKLFSSEGDATFNTDESVVFNGHKSAVTCLAFDGQGHRLASGSRDTVLIVWDVVNECGLFRLKGHKGPISALAFDDDRNVLVSSSKDTMIKFWDLQVQHCFKTMTDHILEVWDFILLKDYLISGTSDSELRVFKLTYDHQSPG